MGQVGRYFPTRNEQLTARRLPARNTPTVYILGKACPGTRPSRCARSSDRSARRDYDEFPAKDGSQHAAVLNIRGGRGVIPTDVTMSGLLRKADTVLLSTATAPSLIWSLHRQTCPATGNGDCWWRCSSSWPADPCSHRPQHRCASDARSANRDNTRCCGNFLWDATCGLPTP
jgi:hypothetical protein